MITAFPSVLHNRKNIFYAGIMVLSVIGIVMLAAPARAGLETTILTMLGWIIFPIVQFLGNILLIVIEILIGVFQFSEFIDTPAIRIGWVVIRDIANIAIVIALLIIAFGTVFRTAFLTYSVQQMLIRLVFAAILVNFSRLIAGLLIDGGQVIMLHFVNAFRALVAGNLVVGFGIEDMLNVAVQTGNNPNFNQSSGLSSIIGALILSVVMLAVAIGVVLAFVVVLLQRIIALWFLVIFSPIAYVAPLIPGAQSWHSKWWSSFIKYVFIGPVLAFGFWLSMTILANTAEKNHVLRLTLQADRQLQTSTEAARLVSEVSSPQGLFDFAVTVALLLGTLFMAKSAGGLAGQFAGKVQGSLTGLARSAGRGASTATGIRRARDVYRDYRGRRDAIRKEGIQRSGARLSALRDTPTAAIASRLGAERTANAARSRIVQERLQRTQTDISRAADAHGVGGQGTNELMELRGNTQDRSLRQAIALELGRRNNGYGENGNAVSEDSRLFAGIEKLQNEFNDNVKKNSENAVVSSNLYNNVANTQNADGSDQLIADILSGTLSVRVLNNDQLRNNVVQSLEARDGAGTAGHTVFQGAKNGDQLQSLLTGLSADARSDLTRGLGQRLASEDPNYQRYRDKREAIARTGNVDEAFNGMQNAADYRRFRQFIKDPQNRSSVVSNLSRSSAGNSRVVRALDNTLSSSELDRMLENPRIRTQLKNTYRRDIEAFERNLTASTASGGRGLAWNSAAFNQAAYNNENMKVARRNLVKITNNVNDAYNVSVAEANEALQSQIRKGKLKARDLKKTKLDPSTQRGGLVTLANALRVSDIANLAEENEEFARQITGVVRDLSLRPGRRDMQNKLDGLQRNYSTGHLV